MFGVLSATRMSVRWLGFYLLLELVSDGLGYICYSNECQMTWVISATRMSVKWLGFYLLLE